MIIHYRVHSFLILLSLGSVYSEITSSREGVIKGKLTLGKQTYESVCECGNVAQTHKRCKVTDSRLVKDRQESEGAQPHQVRSILGYSSPDAAHVQYVAVQDTPFSCVDGRQIGKHLYTPGGDAGELLLALMTYEGALGRNLTEEEVTKALKEFLLSMTQSSLIFCIDSKAQEFLTQIAGFQSVNLERPIASRRAVLLDNIAKPQAQGDLFFKILLKYPSKFGIKSQIVQHFLKALYSQIWLQGDAAALRGEDRKIEVKVLKGDHAQEAFVDIRQGKGCWELVPLVHAKNEEGSIFVNHIDAAREKRAKVFIPFVKKALSHLNSGLLDEINFEKRAQNRALSSFNQFGGVVAKVLPFYTLTLISQSLM